MKNSIAAFVVGFLFALGLGFSGMTQPQKVIGFLDLFGQWDPTLIFVMMGAVGVHLVTYKIIRKRNSPILDEQWHVPTKKEITPALLVGSFIFGVGWALHGFCPGPAIASLASLQTPSLLFVTSMLAGMVLFKLYDKKFKVQK